MIGTEMVPEMLVICKQLRSLIARELHVFTCNLFPAQISIDAILYRRSRLKFAVWKSQNTDFFWDWHVSVSWWLYVYYEKTRYDFLFNISFDHQHHRHISMALQATIFWDISPRRTASVGRRFVGIEHLHFQGPRVSQAKHETGRKQNTVLLYTFNIVSCLVCNSSSFNVLHSA
jgi:hypothetical protein